MGILIPPSRAPRWALPAALALGGCFLLPRDGQMDVRGSLVTGSGAPVENCTLFLRDATGKPRYHERVSGTFEASFTTSPGKESYFVTISCPGHPDAYRGQVFSHSGKISEPPVDLGVVTVPEAGGPVRE